METSWRSKKNGNKIKNEAQSLLCVKRKLILRHLLSLF